MPATAPAVLVPAAAALAVPSAPEILNGVACYKCHSLNNPNAKFCKSCGVSTPSRPPSPSTPLEPSKKFAPKITLKRDSKQRLIILASIAVGVVTIGGGGTYWMSARSGKSGTKASLSTPPTSSTAPVQPSPLQIQPAKAEAVVTPVAATMAAVPAAISSSGATPSAAPAAAALPAIAKDSAPARDEPKPEKPQIALPPLVNPLPDEGKQSSMQAQRNAKENARKKQAEREQAAQRNERDKAVINKANRTLDDLLK